VVLISLCSLGYALDWKNFHEEADKKILQDALVFVDRNPSSVDGLYILALVYLKSLSIPI